MNKHPRLEARLWSSWGRSIVCSFLMMHAAVAQPLPSTAKSEAQQAGGQPADRGSANEDERKIDAAMQAYSEGDYALALQIWQDLLRDWESRPSSSEEPGIALRNIGIIYRAMNQLGTAKTYLERSVTLLRNGLGATDPEVATALSNLGITQDMLGEYAAAKVSLNEALAIRLASLGRMHPYTATTLDGLAHVERNQGNYALSEDLYLQATSIREATLGLSHPSTAASYHNIAQLYAEQGRMKKALESYLKAADIYRRAGMMRHPDWGVVAVSIGALYERIGDLDRAQEYLQNGLDVLTSRIGPGSAYAGLALSNLSLIQKRRGAFAEALRLSELSRSMAVANFGSRHRNTAAAMNNSASLHLILGNLGEAKKLFSESFEVYQVVLGGLNPDAIAAGNNFSIALLVLAEFDRHESLQADLVGREMRLIQKEAPLLPSGVRQEFVAELPDVFEVAFASASLGQRGAQLALFSRLNRQGLLEEIEKRQAQLASLSGPQQQLADELRALTQQLSSLSLTPEQRQALKARQEDLERQLYRLLPELKPRIVLVEQVAAVLPKEGALLEFQRYQPFDGRKKPEERWGEARYLALVLKPGGKVAAVDLGPAAAIEPRIQAALAASEQKKSDALELWASVGDQILDHLAQALQGVQTLFVSPDGELNRIPFAALPAPGSQQLLSETLQLRLLTTGRELLDLAQPSGAAKSGALVVANPAFDRLASSRGSSRTLTTGSSSGATVDSGLASGEQQRSADLGSLSFQPLPGTALEGQAIAELTKGRLLSGEQASASAIESQPAPRLLHIASHAFFLADQPQAKPAGDGWSRSGSSLMGAGSGIRVAALKGESSLLRSGIALAGANQASTVPSDSADDGVLTALEIAQLDWKGTELVVVSACESGKGEILAGEGVYGLKRAIAVAGSRSSLLSLWKVDDRATAAFMESFYRRLKAGTPRAEALAATQQEFRNSAVAAWRHPYVWAAFQLSGDWGPIRW